MTKYRIVKWVGGGNELYFIKYKDLLFWHTMKWYSIAQRVNNIQRWYEDHTILFNTMEEAEEYVRKGIPHEKTVKTIVVK